MKKFSQNHRNFSNIIIIQPNVYKKTNKNLKYFENTKKIQALIIAKFTSRFLWLLHGVHLIPNGMGDIPSGFELLLNLFPVFWSGRADQILCIVLARRL